jgi:hypothetical protein
LGRGQDAVVEHAGYRGNHARSAASLGLGMDAGPGVETDCEKEERMTTSNREWTTANEVAFVHGLGMERWSKSLSCKRAGRLALLQLYKRSCLFRDNWGVVDKGIVLDAVDREIMTCTS